MNTTFIPAVLQVKWMDDVFYFLFCRYATSFTRTLRLVSLFSSTRHMRLSLVKPHITIWYLSFYNVLFTSLPVIALGVFDQDVSANFCLKVRSKFQFVRYRFFNSVLFWISGEWKNLVWWIIFGKTFENKPLLIKQQKGVSNSRKLFRLKKWIQHEHVPVPLFSKTVSDKCSAKLFWPESK